MAPIRSNPVPNAPLLATARAAETAEVRPSAASPRTAAPAKAADGFEAKPAGATPFSATDGSARQSQIATPPSGFDVWSAFDLTPPAPSGAGDAAPGPEGTDGPQPPVDPQSEFLSDDVSQLRDDQTAMAMLGEGGSDPSAFKGISRDVDRVLTGRRTSGETHKMDKTVRDILNGLDSPDQTPKGGSDPVVDQILASVNATGSGKGKLDPELEKILNGTPSKKEDPIVSALMDDSRPSKKGASVDDVLKSFEVSKADQAATPLGPALEALLDPRPVK